VTAPTRLAPRSTRAQWVRAALLLTVLLRAALAAKPRGENVHRPQGDCAACHTADAATLGRDGAAARKLLAPDLEERCNGCHGDEGPSHPTGVRSAKTVPELPLTDDRRITCPTCHFMHGESNAFGDFLRLDNRRGGMCLSCHQLSELQ